MCESGFNWLPATRLNLAIPIPVQKRARVRWVPLTSPQVQTFVILLVQEKPHSPAPRLARTWHLLAPLLLWSRWGTHEGKRTLGHLSGPTVSALPAWNLSSFRGAKNWPLYKPLKDISSIVLEATWSLASYFPSTGEAQIALLLLCQGPQVW